MSLLYASTVSRSILLSSPFLMSQEYGLSTFFSMNCLVSSGILVLLIFSFLNSRLLFRTFIRPHGSDDSNSVSIIDSIGFDFISCILSSFL